MFIRLYDARANSNMLLSVREILVVKDYLTDGGTVIEGAKAVVMTRPVDRESGATHNYYVSETVDDVESLIATALDSVY